MTPKTDIIDFNELSGDEGEQFSEALIVLLKKQLELDKKLRALITGIIDITG